MIARRPVNGRAATRAMTALYRRPERLPADWRDRLPDPERYYREHVSKLGKANPSGWAQGRCPFHDDRSESFSADLRRGGWKCFAGCGSGDLVAFEMRRTGRPFMDAARALVGVSV